MSILTRLSRLFHGRRWKPHDWVVIDGERRLYRLEYQGFADGFHWMEHSVVCLDGSWEMMEKFCGLKAKPDILPWVLENPDTVRGFRLVISR